MEEQQWLQEWGSQGLQTNKKKEKAQCSIRMKDDAGPSLVPLPDDQDLLLGYLINRMCVYSESKKLLPEALQALVNKKMIGEASAHFIKQYPREALTAYKERFNDLNQILKGGEIYSRYARDFEEVSELGQGSAGVVRLCKHKRDGHRYAVKIIDIQAQEDDESDDNYEERIRFIEREAKTLADMKHENVVRYYQSWYEGADSVEICQLRYTQNVDRLFFIQMEYCGRLSLESLLDEGSIKDNEERLDIFMQLVKALHYIHSRNVIHRDLCPKNLFVDRHHIVKIGDFGLAKHHGGTSRSKSNGNSNDSYKWSESTQSHTTDVGTEYYAAPEVSSSSRFDTKADIYSLGVVFFDICNGKRQGSNRDVYSDLKKGSLPLSFIARFPKEASLVAGMINANPAERPSTKRIMEALMTYKAVGVTTIDLEEKAKEYKAENDASSKAPQQSPKKMSPLSSLKGTGPIGHIIKADVEEYPLVQTSSEKVTVHETLLLPKQTIPRYDLTVDMRLDNLLVLKSKLNNLQEESGGNWICINDFVLKAAAMALRKVPECNSLWWTDDFIRQYHDVNIRVAVETDLGLLAPVVQNVDKKGLTAIAEDVKTLADKAKKNSLKPADYEGGTFAVSNLGEPFGVQQFCAIVNPPQACILSVGQIDERVVSDSEGGFITATFMSVVLSCDHRVADGAIGAGWLGAFKGYIEDPATLVL